MCMCACTCARVCTVGPRGYAVHPFQALPLKEVAPHLGPPPSARVQELGEGKGLAASPGKLAREVSYCSCPLRESPPCRTKDTALGGGRGGPKSAPLLITEQGTAGRTQTGHRDSPGHPPVLAAGPRWPAHERWGWPREKTASVCREYSSGISAARLPLHCGSWTTVRRRLAASGGHRGASLQK